MFIKDLLEVLNSNLGKRIQIIANVLFIIDIIASFLIGALLIYKGIVLYGICSLIGGLIVSILIHQFVSSFGYLIQKAEQIERNTRN